jgi:hypothetical protein
MVLIFCFSSFLLGVDCYIVHVDGKSSSCDLFVKYHIHHCLEGCWRVGQPEEHYHWFKESQVGYKGCLVLVLGDYPYHVISPPDVNRGDEFHITYSVYELGNER